MFMKDVLVIGSVYVIVYALMWLVLYRRNDHDTGETRREFGCRFTRVSLLVCYVFVPFYFLMSRSSIGVGIPHMAYGILLVHAVLFQLVVTLDFVYVFKDKKGGMHDA